MSRWKLLFTIFAVTFSTMLVEVLLTRVFSVLYFGQFAFLIISLALFGYGLSGVFLALGGMARSGAPTTRLLARFLLLFAVSLPLAYKATLLLSIDFLHLFNPASNLLFLVLNCLILVVPFFFGGVVLALIFRDLFRPDRPPLFHRPGRGQPRLPGHHPAHPAARPEPDPHPFVPAPRAGLVLPRPRRAGRSAPPRLAAFCSLPSA